MEIYIHVGYPKAASTFFQKKFFNKLELQYLGKPYKDKIINKIIFSCLYDDDLSFQNTKRKYSSELKKIFKSKKVLISEENILNSIRFPKNQINIIYSLKRIRDFFSTFGSVKFLLIIRNQISILDSFFSHFHKELFFLGYTRKDFLETLEGKSNKFERVLDNFKYFNVYNYIRNMVGEKSILLLFYEDFEKNPKRFLYEINLFFALANIERKYSFEKVNSSKNWEIRNYLQFVFGKVLSKPKSVFIINNYKLFFKNLEKRIYKIFYKKNFDLKKNSKLIINYFNNDLKNFDNKNKIKLIEYGYLLKK